MVTALLTTLLLLSPPPTAEPAQEQLTPKERFESLLKEYEAAYDAYNAKRFAPTAPKDDIDHTIRTYLAWPAFEFVPRFLKLAEDHPGDAAAVDALLWIIRTTIENDRGFYPAYARSLEILARDHMQDKRIGRVCLIVGDGSSASREKFLRAVLAQGIDRETRGRACLGLAESLLNKRDFVQGHDVRGTWFARNDFSDYRAKERIPAEFLAYFQRADLAALADEAEALLDRVGQEFADVKYATQVDGNDADSTLGGVAERDLFRLRHLALGSPALETAGEDIEGKPVSLADYRGKVVLLSFWGTWCTPCMAMVPHERALARRLKGKPFAILGVDADEDREKAREVMAAKGMTWRSLWDGRDTAGPISRQWDVRGWPTFIVIDHRGVIRYRAMNGSQNDLNAVIDKLLKDVEASEGRGH